ncbi:MAG TPA: hypothetical protein VE177_00210 [Candidatus Binatus sp.]|nr:hypothetical protein [Candidatus Binatus sp.]
MTAKDEDLEFTDILRHLDRESSHVTVRLETRRFGKPMTVVQVHGIPKNDKSIDTMGQTLKRRLATGGTVKDGMIELQGDQVLRLKPLLLKMGFTEDNIEIID